MDSDVIKHKNQDFHPGQVLEVKTLTDDTKCELLLLGMRLVFNLVPEPVFCVFSKRKISKSSNKDPGVRKLQKVNKIIIRIVKENG
jgi:hypothetical protein